MKTCRTIMLGAAVTLWLFCKSSAAVVPAMVGPNPFSPQNSSASGQLEVFSALEGRSEGNNPSWHQHADYYLCDQQGRHLRHVDNTVGYYAQAPRVITLPPGKYLVKAPAKDALWLEVPVVIESGRITKVHLDGDWKLPADTSETKFVDAPAGYPVGWRAGDAQ